MISFKTKIQLKTFKIPKMIINFKNKTLNLYQIEKFNK